MTRFASWVRVISVLGVFFGLCACTASKDIRTAQKRLRSVQDFRGVDMTTVSKPLDEYRKAEEDEVLYHLERAMLAHYKEQWDQSSRHFQQAERAIERNFTKSINRNVQSMLVNDLQLAYHGEAYEDVYLNAVKSLNYLHQNELDGAMVEARRVTHELEQLSDRYKGLAESLSRDTAQTAVKKVDERLNNVDLLDAEDQQPTEVKQNSALGRFLTTVLYAKTGSPDDARIELRKLRTALDDQGNTGFLTALRRGQDTTSVRERDPGPPSRSTPALALRLTTREAGPPPALSIRVNGDAAYSLSPDSLQRRGDGYGVRFEGIPAAPGDSISIVSEMPVSRGARLEVWSDSLQYRGGLREGQSHATFVLGTPVTTGMDAREWAPDTTRGTSSSESALQPAELSYALTQEAPEGRTQKRLVRSLTSVRGPTGRSWRVTERIEPTMGGRSGAPVRVDTMLLSHPTLELEHHRHGPSRGSRLSVRHTGDRIVESSGEWTATTVDKVPSGRIYGEGAGVEMALAERSLSVGEHVPLSVYVSSEQAVRRIEAQVLGTDSIATPAGRFAAYDVRLVPPAAHYGTARLYLRESPPHHVLQATTRLPVLVSGRRDTLTLKRTLTSVSRSDDPGPSSPAVVSRKTMTPPADLPTVRVGGQSQTQDGATDASGGGTGAAPQLSKASTYNTMLVSFSGQAPIKRERKFSFNFTIDGEEFQLDFAIPVLELQGTTVDEVRAIANGDTLTMPLLEEMQAVAEAMFDEKKSIIYTRAVIRSFLKAAATKGAQKLAEEKGNAGMAWLAKQAGQMASSYVAQADTRGWQTMPGFAYATVTKLPPGTHEVTFEFLSSAGTVMQRRTRQVEVGGADDLALAESIYLE